MYKVIEFNEEEQYIRDFLELPRSLYEEENLMQNIEEEKDILLGQHILSKYFKVYKYLAYKDDVIAARCILTVYPNDLTLYFGYYESINDKDVIELLFNKINEFAKANGFAKIYGPVDCSFWIKYRLKTNYFNESPYFGEPYNKEYYLKLLQSCGFEITETYVSNFFGKISIFNKNFNQQKKKYKQRHKNFKKNGYKIISPSKKDFDKVLKEVYGLLMELYSDFPVFKHLSDEDFIKHFQSFKYIADYKIIKMAYYKGEAVGFFIGIPDYRNALLGKLNLLTYARIFMNRIRSNNYVMLYMGVKKEHQGLGKALVKTVLKNVILKHSTAISALTKEGRKTKTYFEDHVNRVYEYVLLEKKV